MADSDKYSVFYDVNLFLVVGKQGLFPIDHEDIVSFTISHQYDTKTYPLIRLRLYSDLSLLQEMVDDPDNIRIRGSIISNVCITDDTGTPTVVRPTGVFADIDLKVYLEYKNIATSKMDKYSVGLPRSIEDSLNVNNKVPIEIFCYDDRLIHSMRDQAQAVFKGMNLQTVVKAMLDHCNVYNSKIDTFYNKQRFDQILIPNLSIIDAFSFFDTVYGLYPKGGMMYGDIDSTLYISNLSSNNDTKPLPIYVGSYQNDSNQSGLMKTDAGYFMQTAFENVSVLTESDIERVLRAERITAVNVETLESSTTDLPFYQESETQVTNDLLTKQANDNISPTLMLHKSTNPYVATMSAARVNETVTRVDISGAGWDILAIKPTTRFNLIFESPLRGVDMAAKYRPAFANHVLTTVGHGTFTSQTTMTLCKN